MSVKVLKPLLKLMSQLFFCHFIHALLTSNCHIKSQVIVKSININNPPPTSEY